MLEDHAFFGLLARSNDLVYLHCLVRCNLLDLLRNTLFYLSLQGGVFLLELGHGPLFFRVIVLRLRFHIFVFMFFKSLNLL